jgi:MFS family permease
MSINMNDNSRSIVLFTGISHAIVHTYELSIPILVAIWLVEFPVTTATLGVVVSIGYALFGIGALPGGVLADRLGSRTLILGCLAGMGLSFLLLSFAPGVITIAIALAAWGIAASVYHPSGLSLLSTGVDNRGSAFAYHGMAGNIGIAFGPLLTALLLLTFDWRMVTRLLVIPTIVAIAYALTTEFNEVAAVTSDGSTDEDYLSDENSSMSFSMFLADSRSLFTLAFSLAMVVVMMNGLFYRGMLTFLPDVLDQFLPPVSNYIQLFEPGTPVAEKFTLSSYVYVGLLIIGIGGQYTGGKISDRISPTTGLAFVFASLMIISISFVPAARIGLLPLLAVCGLLGFFLFALQPLYQATIANHSPPDDRGLSYGYTYLISFGIGASGAALSGYLLTLVGVDGTFFSLALFPGVGIVVAYILKNKGKEGEKTEQ